MNQAFRVAWESPVGQPARPLERAWPTSAAAGLHLELHRDIAALKEEWIAFQQHADCTVFQSHEWLATWQECIGSAAGVRPAIVSGRNDRGDLVFLFPLAVERRSAIRELTWLGSNLNDYNAPLLAAAFSRGCDEADFHRLWSEVLALLQQVPELNFDIVRLEKMPLHVGDQANPFVHLAVRLNPSGAYRTQLGDDWETFYAAKRSSTTRRRDRTKRKKLAELGEVSFVTAGAAADITCTMQTLFAQKAAAFARMGVADLFAQPGYKKFFQTLAASGATQHLAHVSRLDVGQTLSAINLGLIFRGVYYHVLASYEAGETAKFGPGAAHLRDLMSYAISRRCSMFDFTIGDEPYKREWSEIELKLYDHVSCARLIGLPIVLVGRVVSTLKRIIKQTPALWSLATRLRALLGAR